MSIAKAELAHTPNDMSRVIADLAYTALAESGRYEPDFMSLSMTEEVMSHLSEYGIHTEPILLHQRGAETPTHAHLYLGTPNAPVLATVTDLREYRERTRATLPSPVRRAYEPDFASAAIAANRRAESGPSPFDI